MGVNRLVTVLALALALAAPAFSQPAMPDLQQMSGVPLPVSDVAIGTVTVRVIRGSLANVVPGQEVQLLVAGTPRTGRTNEAGRAEFSGLTPGTRVRAITTVDGVQLQSQEFDVPAAGGVRLMLVAPAAGGAGPVAPTGNPDGAVQAGSVVLGDQSRFVFEMGDESLTGFYILQVVNQSATPVQPVQPFSLDLPEGATGASIMQGSSPQASIAGRTLVVAGPFAPGQTQVQVAFSVPYTTADLTVVQRLPVPLSLVTLLVEKVGAMQVESAQVSQHREVKAAADTYILGQGPGLKAGDTLTVRVTGLPHRPFWPRNTALTLAALILAAGVWASVRPGQAAAAEGARRQKLSAKRERLFADLAGIEAQRRAGGLDESRYTVRRAELMGALERIYAELDEEAAA